MTVWTIPDNVLIPNIILDDSQVNDDNDDGVKGSSFSFVRSDSMPSKDEESSGDENHTQFAFIKEKDDVNDDVPLQSQDHESVKSVAENVSPIISTYVYSYGIVCVYVCACLCICVVVLFMYV